MKIKKYVRIEKILIPNSEIRITDQLETIMLEVMKFIKLKQKTNPKEIRLKLGFTEVINNAIINRLKIKSLIKGSDTIELNKKGLIYLSKDKIFEDKIIELRLIVTDSPHFVLRHSFYHLSENYVTSTITKETIEKRKEVSGLFKSITNVGDKIYSFEDQEGLIEVSLNEISNGILTVRSKTDKYKYPVTIYPTDDEVKADLSQLLDLLSTDRTNSFNNILGSMNDLEGFQVELNEGENEIFELVLNSRINVSIDNLLKFNNWLTTGIHNRNDDRWSFELSIFKGWFVKVEFYIVSSSSRVIHLLFSHYLLNNNVDDLLDSLDFKSQLKTIWDKFIESYNTQNYNLDHYLLFKLLWEFRKNQSLAKLIAGRIIEERILI